MKRESEQTVRAKLRQTQTKAERILWSLLRSKQLYGLKFRRQHFIEPFYADFACMEKKLVFELDGEYHDGIIEEDLRRQCYFESLGWKGLRFAYDEVLHDADAVLRSIAKELGLPSEFRKRNTNGSGIMNRNAPGDPNRDRPF